MDRESICMVRESKATGANNSETKIRRIDCLISDQFVRYLCDAVDGCFNPNLNLVFLYEIVIRI